MTYFTIVVQQIMMFVIYAVIGVICVKTKVLSTEGLEWISRLVIKVLLPLMIFTNTINGATREDLIEGLPMILAAAIMYACLFLLGFLLTCISGLKGNERNAYYDCSVFGNVGFMGIPLISALLPEGGMIYVALFTIVDTFCLWTIGLSLAQPVDGGKKLTLKETAVKMINPSTVGITLAIIILLAGIQLPSVLNSALVKTGAAASPLAMIYLGGLFSTMNFGECLKRKEYYVTVLVKMVAFPLVFGRLIGLLPGVTENMVLVLTVISAVPTMSSIAMVIKSQHSAGEYAAGMTFVTTLFSIITIPLVCLLM